jgi:hypothetical protein
MTASGLFRRCGWKRPMSAIEVKPECFEIASTSEFVPLKADVANDVGSVRFGPLP